MGADESGPPGDDNSTHNYTVLILALQNGAMSVFFTQENIRKPLRDVKIGGLASDILPESAYRLLQITWLEAILIL
jgi:hypothetical protein